MKIITLTLNPAIDIHCEGKTLTLEKENFFTITNSDMGGKGINISRALNAYGIENTCYVLLGKENGSRFLEELKKEGLNCKVFYTEGKIRENITIHPENAKETRISFEGFKGGDSSLSLIECELLKEELKDSFLILAGSIPKGISTKKVLSLLFKVKEKGAKVILDSRSFSPEEVYSLNPYLIKPNQEEILTYLKEEVSCFNSAKKAANEIRIKGVENVLLSLGDKGAVLSSKEGDYFIKAPKINVKSTIGAGDSTIAGFVASKLKGYDDEASLLMAVSFGSAACMEEGTKAPKRESIDRILGSIKVERI